MRFFALSEIQSFPFVSTTQSEYSLKLIKMCFNKSFDYDVFIYPFSLDQRAEPDFIFQDSCELVAIGFGLKEYCCGWTFNGLPCNALVLGQDFPTHLKTVHRTNDTPRLECLWSGCGEVLNKECLVRHVQENHLEYRWPCPNPKCDRIFTRRGVLDTHRAACTA
jgi:hypothetical protein